MWGVTLVDGQNVKMTEFAIQGYKQIQKISKMASIPIKQSRQSSGLGILTIPKRAISSQTADATNKYTNTARALRALELLLADGAPTVGGGRLFDGSTKNFLRKLL